MTPPVGIRRPGIEPVRHLKIRNKESGVITEISASPEGFFNLKGGSLVCGRCGVTVVQEFTRQHFALCRLVFREFAERKIILPGE